MDKIGSVSVRETEDGDKDAEMGQEVLFSDSDNNS